MFTRKLAFCFASVVLIAAAPSPTPTSGAIVGEIRVFAISDKNANSLNELYAAGWVPADGRELPVVVFSKLNTALGDTWGKAQNASSFRVPDLRGLFLRGYSGASGRDPDAAARISLSTGGATGNTVGSYQADTLQRHRHADAGHIHGLNETVYTGGCPPCRPGPYPQGGGAALSTAVGYAQIGDPTGARTAIETRPANVTVYYFIFTGKTIPIRLRTRP